VGSSSGESRAILSEEKFPKVKSQRGIFLYRNARKSQTASFFALMLAPPYLQYGSLRFSLSLAFYRFQHVP
jgi:hypothetical protein